ncbi:MAG: hybrid sensor histidine kinase/response regulator [Verrucomicrobia bacterium]|nr:MAG: hybrid sensor histidine kinase/response regulator [Verrucomicrobiota bacterium]
MNSPDPHMTQPDYKRFIILYVDDEEKSLKGFTRAFNEQFRILTASNAQDGLKLLEAHADEIGLLMTDQRMPGEKGVWLLERARTLNPGIVRILATAYSDLEAAINAVNSGAIYKFVSKPWDPPQLEQTLKRALEFFVLQRERDELLREKLSVLHNMMIADRLVSLGLLAAGLSHHIRNALVAVKTFLDLAPAKLEEERAGLPGLRDPDFWRDYYHSVQGQIERINNLLKDLWAASDASPAQFADFVTARDLVQRSLDPIHAKLAAKKITVANDIPVDLPNFKADEPKLLRVFDLLLRDELASLPDGSKITFTASVAGDDKKPEIEIRVSDNGPGLPQEAVRVLFDPFVVRGDTPAEYGINLMACFFIVYHHGGKIEAESGPGRGTTFKIRLPMNPDRAVHPDNGQDFLKKAVLNESLWQKLLAHP